MNSHQKYGLLTAISMMVGAVIGSGVFFKAEAITLITGGNVFSAVSAWVVGAAAMLLCLFAFALITKADGAEGICTIAERIVGDKYAYCFGWFIATVYYPSLVSVLAYLSARYTLMTVGAEGEFFLSVIVSCAYLLTAFFQNAFFPRFSGKVQIVATLLKLIPLVLMIILGITKGVKSGILYENIALESKVPFSKSFFPATTATLFAYEGWISLTSVGKELKNSRRNLPVALLGGGFIIASVYILYYLGIMGAVSSQTFINYGTEGINIAFANVLGKWGRLLTAFVAISCVGALNALVMGCGRSFYELSLSGHGPASKLFSRTMKGSGMPFASFVAGGILSLFWLFYLFETQGNFSLLRGFHFDSTELPVVTIYVFYIPIFFRFAKKEKNNKSIILCAGGICASLFSAVCGVLSHGSGIISYLMVLSGIMLLGSLFYKNKKRL